MINKLTIVHSTHIYIYIYIYMYICIYVCVKFAIENL